MWLANNDLQARYIQSVKNATVDENSFKTFKIDINYNNIVGMSEAWQAPLFYDFVEKNNKEIFEKIYKFTINDVIGSPVIWQSKDGINISPNTIRYVKTLVDLVNHFGDLDGFTIAELGVGYGGLACIINTNNKLQDYVIYDLPEVQEFCKKYLSALGINSITTDNQKYENYDLFISEFCLSEFNDIDIYKFYNNIIKKSKRIYLMMNLHDETRKQKFINTIKKDFNIIILDEYPKTIWPNYIIIGTKN